VDKVREATLDIQERKTKVILDKEVPRDTTEGIPQICMAVAPEGITTLALEVVAMVLILHQVVVIKEVKWEVIRIIMIRTDIHQWVAMDHLHLVNIQILLIWIKVEATVAIQDLRIIIPAFDLAQENMADLLLGHHHLLTLDMESPHQATWHPLPMMNKAMVMEDKEGTPRKVNHTPTILHRDLILLPRMANPGDLLHLKTIIFKLMRIPILVPQYL